MNANDFKIKLTELLEKCPSVKAIAQTGDIDAPLIPGKSDIDLFVLCDSVPTCEEREALYVTLIRDYSELHMGVCNGGIWGHGDIFQVEGIDVMPMFFEITEMSDYLNEVLEGKHLDNEGGFYPVGRLASVETINILYEENREWSKLKEKVCTYPEKLFDRLFQHHIGLVLNEEDLGRVTLRKEVLFYHMVLEYALDHFLQALFAANHCYFPSRKRSEKYISTFKVKPENCYVRLMSIVKNSIDEATIEQSINDLQMLTNELNSMYVKR